MPETINEIYGDYYKEEGREIHHGLHLLMQKPRNYGVRWNKQLMPVYIKMVLMTILMNVYSVLLITQVVALSLIHI